MLTKQRKTAKGLKVILVVTYLLFAIFAAGYVWFGLRASKTSDPDINNGLFGFFKYTFSDLGLFFTYRVRGLIRIFQLVLPGLFYAFTFLFVIYLIVGIAVGKKKHRAIPAASLIAVFLSLVTYFITATTLSKYLAAIANEEPLKNVGALMIVPAVLVIFSSVFLIVFAYISYFASLVEAIKNPRVEAKPEQEATSEEAPKAEGNQETTAAEIAYTEEPVMFEPIEDPQMEFEPLPEPEPQEEEKAKEEPSFSEEPKEEKQENNNDDLKSLLREVVRDIVRDEIARNNANQPKSDFNPLAGGSITGATFGGPLVVQYFNGGINSPAAPQGQQAEPAPAPQPAPAPVEEKPAPQPVKEEPQPEPEPEEVVEEPVQEPEPEPQPEPAPVEEAVEPAPEEPVQEEEPQPEPQPEEPIEEPVQEPAPEEPVSVEEAVEEPVAEPQPAPVPEEKKPIIRIPFTERMINADDEMKNNYNELKNEILSYGVNYRVSNSGDTFRLHRKTYVKITIAGLSLKLYFALDPEDYKDSTLPIQNAGHKGIYAEIPLVFKVKSGLSMRRCKQLIQDLMDKNGLEQGEIKQIDWVEKLKAEPQEEAQEEAQEASEE